MRGPERDRGSGHHHPLVFPPAPKKGMVKFPGKGHFKRAKTG